jgi:hypothetical protein
MTAAWKFFVAFLFSDVGQDRLVGIATRYGLEVRG